ncbi:hypothetical protein D9M71_534160 [compost metagenome]
MLSGMLPINRQLDVPSRKQAQHHLLSLLIEQPLTTITTDNDGTSWNQLDPLRRLAVGNRCGAVGIECE